ncbi:MAG: uroporphyrinogen-III synthase [Acidobacteriota bacterium]
MSRLGAIRVVVTRAHSQNQLLVTVLAAAGADVITLPLLEVVPPAQTDTFEQATANVSDYDLIALTSSNSVAALHTAGVDPKQAPPVVTVGPATTKAARQAGFEIAIEATRADAEGLLTTLDEHVDPGTSARVLLPQAADARPTLAAGLRIRGHIVTVVEAYDKRLPETARDDAHRLFGDRPFGWVTFTSPRIVRHFVDLWDDWQTRRSGLAAVSIGPVTSRALRAAGVTTLAEATQPTPAAMVEAIEALVV